MLDLIVIVLRAAANIATLQAAGIALFLSALGGDIDASRPRIVTIARISIAAGVILLIAEQAFQPARMLGSIAGVADPMLHRIWLESGAGVSAGLRVAGLVLMAVALRRRSDLLAMAGALTVVVSFAAMGHTTTHEPRWLPGAVLVLHVAIVAFWLGALAPLHVVVRREPPDAAGRIVAGFSRIATRAVPLILLAGVLLAYLLLPDWRRVASPYGFSLLAKLGAFAALLWLAALNKWRLVPLVEAGDAAGCARFRRSLLAEWLLIAIALAVTAVLTTLYSPG